MPEASLKSWRFLNTRNKEDAPFLTQLLQKQGAEVDELPLTRFAPPDNWKVFDSGLEGLDPNTWLLWTSKQAVKACLSRLSRLGYAAEFLQKNPSAAVGPKTAAYCKKKGLPVNFVPKEYNGQSLLNGLEQKLPKEANIFWPAAQKPGKALAEGLKQQKNWKAKHAPVYQNLSTQPSRQMVEESLSKVHWVLFTSSLSVEIFQSLHPKELPSFLKLACLGPPTRNRAQEVGWKVNFMPQKADLEVFVEELAGFCRLLPLKPLPLEKEQKNLP